jgi:Domain of unknown function (DUF4136)
MKFRSRLIASVGLMLVLANVSFAQHVKTDYDHNAHFGQYRTYSWTNVQTRDPFLVDRIKNAVNSVLAAKGWMEVPSGGNAAISATEITQNQQTIDTLYSGFGGRRWGGFGDATTTVETYKVGTFVVSIFDTHTNNLIWRGSSSDTLSDKSDKNIKNLDKGVQKMFAHFPPGLLEK